MIATRVRFISRLGLGGSSCFAAAILCGLLLLGTSPALATSLEIQFTGANLSYSGNTLSDAGSPAGGGGDPAFADPLDSVTFKVGGVLVPPMLTSDISLDVSIPDVAGLSDTAVSTVVTTPGNPGYFDLLIGTTPSAAQYLRLNTTEVTVTYINVTSSVHFVFGGAVAAIDAQMLPPGLEIGDPVTVSFSSVVDSKTAAADIVTSFLSSGTGEINGTFIPEPSTCILAVLGLGAAFARRRR